MECLSRTVRVGRGCARLGCRSRSAENSCERVGEKRGGKQGFIPQRCTYILLRQWMLYKTYVSFILLYVDDSDSRASTQVRVLGFQMKEISTCLSLLAEKFFILFVT